MEAGGADSRARDERGSMPDEQDVKSPDSAADAKREPAEAERTAEASVPPNNPPNIPPKAPDPQKKASAGEVLSGLRDDIGLMAARLDEVADFSRRAKKTLLQSAETFRLEGRLQACISLFSIHDIVFRQLGSEPPDQSKPDNSQQRFLASLLDAIEGELERNDVLAVVPRPGDRHDSTVMSILATRTADEGHKDGTVAKVHRCGFVLKMKGLAQALRKAEVDIYRK